MGMAWPVWAGPRAGCFCVGFGTCARAMPTAQTNTVATFICYRVLLSDADLARLIPTVFVSGGESVLTLLLGNLEHLINHKRQLFTYLQLLNVPVTTRDLYRFRGE